MVLMSFPLLLPLRDGGEGGGHGETWDPRRGGSGHPDTTTGGPVPSSPPLVTLRPLPGRAGLKAETPPQLITCQGDPGAFPTALLLGQGVGGMQRGILGGSEARP